MCNEAFYLAGNYFQKAAEYVNVLLGQSADNSLIKLCRLSLLKYENRKIVVEKMYPAFLNRQQPNDLIKIDLIEAPTTLRGEQF